MRAWAWVSQSNWQRRCSEPDLLSQPSSDREPKVLQSELMVLDQCQVNGKHLPSPVAGTIMEEAVDSSAVKQLCGRQQIPAGPMSEYPRV